MPSESKVFRLFVIAFIYLINPFTSSSQGAVGIGTNNPDPSAILDVKSTNKGMLIPRVNRAPNTTVVSSPVKGLIVFNENVNFNAFEYYDGSDWIQLIPTPSKFDLNMSSNKIINVASGTIASDAINKGQLDAVQSTLSSSISTTDNNNLDRDGTDVMTGNLNMNNRKVLNLSNGTNSSDAVNRGQLNGVQDLIQNLEGRVVETYTVANGGTTVPTALQNGILFSPSSTPATRLIHQRSVTNNSTVTKSYFCMAFVNFGGPGNSRDITLQLTKDGTIFSRWRKLIRTADRRAEDLYMITGRFTLAPGESSLIVNSVRLQAGNLYYDNRGMIILSEF